jgi:hypothetical protein
MNLSYNAPTSMRSSGRCQALATALAASDLPAPCTPSISTPRGASMPKLTALVAERVAALAEPTLELRKSANLVERHRRFHVLEQPVASQRLPLARQDVVDVRFVEAAIVADAFGDHLSGPVVASARAGCGGWS